MCSTKPSGPGATPPLSPQASEDYFHDMDRAVALTPDEVKGRNMWLVWTGGNDRFWDRMTGYTFGAFDLLKIVTSRPGQKFDRDTRWSWLGLVNEPCFAKPSDPIPSATACGWTSATPPVHPTRSRTRRPIRAWSSARAARLCRWAHISATPAASSACGCFPIRTSTPRPPPAGTRRNTTPSKLYYNDPKLVRPYRVGMSCGFCHVGPSPVNPPADPAHPAFANLSSVVGAQYMWVDRLFINDARASNFMYQLVHTYRPGSMDTSLVSTDSINNPRTMNAIYNLGPRLEQGRRWGQETLAGGGLNNKQFNAFVHTVR